MNKNETNFETGARNVAIDTVGRGSGMFIGGAIAGRVSRCLSVVIVHIIILGIYKY